MWRKHTRRAQIGLRSFLLVSFLLLILTFPPNTLLKNASAQSGLSYVPISVTNNQPIPTQTPFQQSITINPSLYTQYESANLGNIRFFSSFSGSIFSNELFAWMESFSGSPTANLATSATIWISLPSGISSTSTITIYMVFENSSTNFDGVFWGEAPALSPSYGQYDNGANVFSVYNNGLALFPSAQTGTGGSGPITTSSAPSPNLHAITGSVSGGGGGANTWTTDGETSTSLPSSYVAQMLVYLGGSAPLTDLMTNVQSISTGQFYVFRFDARGGSYDLVGNYPSGGTSTNILAQSATTSLVGAWYQMTAIDSSDSLSLFKSNSFNLGSFGTLEAGPVLGKGYVGGGIAITTDGATSTEYWTMVSVRAYPPNGVMPSESTGSVMTVVPSAPYSTLYSQSNSTIQKPSIVLQTTSSPTYVPILITNSQAVPTRSGLQVPLNIDFNNFKSYLASDAGNIRFFNSTTFTPSYELPAWLELYSGNTSNGASTATNSEVWLSLKGTVIPASSSVTVYMVFESGVDFDGSYFGEAPQLSHVYGQFDNGANVFVYYNPAPSGTSGWTIKGVAGQTSSAPTGSHFKSTDAYYANSANGDYMDSLISNLGTNEVITFWVYTTGLGNVFFLDSSTGAGQMARIDSRGGGNWAGLATTTSWTQWTAPTSGLDEVANTWYKYDIVMNSTGASAYIGASANNISTLGTRANALTISNKGGYMGLVGDGLGSAYVTYWNGFVIRYYPTAGVMPTISVGAVVTPAISETVMPQLNEGSIGLASGMTFYESASPPTTCTSPTIDTNLTQPATSSSYLVASGSSVCLWSPKFSNSSALNTGSWVLNLWASATSAGTMKVSIYSTNSSGGVVSTILSNGVSNTITTSSSQVITSLAGSGANLAAGGYVEVVLGAPVSGPASFTIYWGNGQLTNFESPVLFNNVLAINNTSTSPWYLNLGVASSTNTARLSNLTAWFSSVASPQISLGSSVTSQQLLGPQVVISGSSTLYLYLNAAATSTGSSTVVVSLKVQSFQGGPYSQYTIILQLN